MSARTAATKLDVNDLNFIERAVFDFAFHEEGATADPQEPLTNVMDRAMARVTPFLRERRKRLAATPRAVAS